MTTRFVAGCLSAKAVPGTLLGPKDITGEWMVVLDDGVSVSYATNPELMEGYSRVLAGDIQSLAERKMWEEFNRAERANRRRELGTSR